jgi:putative protein-disulfide isomerase
LEGIAEMATDKAALSVVTGGLRAGERRPMDHQLKGYVRHHWEEVQKATGQPFDFSFFEREGFVYDTEPACRAVVIVRSADPANAVPYFSALHRAFYAQGQDITDRRILADIAEPFGVSKEVFLDAYADPGIGVATQADFQYARDLGVQGFPTVICRADDQWAYLTSGFQPFEVLRPALADWLSA